MRHAIVHERGRRLTRFIAEPAEEIVSDLRDIVETLTKPEPITSIAASPVQSFPSASPLTDVLSYMRTHVYSQVVVQDDGLLQLLTASGIANWLEDQAPIGLANLEEATVADALAVEPEGSFAVLPRSATAFEALDRSWGIPVETSGRLFALLVTHSGKRSERAIGIVTPWDLGQSRQLRRALPH
ncbi:MAG: CBS domain-containing protein [Thermomicrobiales bacterium]